MKTKIMVEKIKERKRFLKNLSNEMKQMMEIIKE